MSLELFEGVRDLFVDDDGAMRLSLDGIAYGNLAHVVLYQMLNPNLEFPATRRPLARLLKVRGLDWQVRFMYGRLLGKNKHIEACPNGGGLVLFTIYNHAVIHSLLPVYQKLTASGNSPVAIFSDPGMRRAVPGSLNGLSYASFYKLADEREVNRKWPVLRNQLAAYSATLKTRLKKLAGEVEIDADRIVAFLNPFLKQSLRDAQAIKRILGRCRPRYLVMGSDANKLGRLFSMMARQSGIRTVVVQHGATVDPYGYVPLYADRAAVWGEISKAWYLQHGVPESQLVITGNPQLDAVRVQSSIPAHSGSRLILATNPLSREVNERLLEAAGSVAREHGLSLKVRPHPSEDPTFYEQFIQREAADAELCTGSLDELIRPGDILVTCNSTIGIDALLRGALLVVIEVPGVGAPIPYKRYGVAESIALAELDALIADVLKGAVERDEAKTATFLQDYLGKLDGASATRIATLLTP
ncbi:MAG: hypothetical protein HKN59_03680 [Gammaproteobacteria bacterium]|nr:hypothetical protein [Gammaproteobacteria bacterium]